MMIISLHAGATENAEAENASGAEISARYRHDPAGVENTGVKITELQ